MRELSASCSVKSSEEMLEGRTHLKPAAPSRVWYNLITSAPCGKARKVPTKYLACQQKRRTRIFKCLSRIQAAVLCFACKQWPCLKAKTDFCSM